MLAEELGVSERTLRRGVAAGLIRGRRPSPRRLRLAPGERPYLRRHWGLLAGLREALRTERGVRLAVLFGSAARGDDLPGSDVDILVSAGDADFWWFASLGRRLSGAVGRDVQLVTLAQGEAAPWLLGDVLREGRVLVDRDGEWSRLQARRDEVLQEAARREREREREAQAAIERMAAAGAR